MAISNSQPLPVRPALMLVAADRAAPEAVQALRPPEGVALMPTEAVLLLAVELPAMPAAQRRAAVGFAVEDRIAQALDEVQVVPGPQVAPGIWLVAVTSRAVLAGQSAGQIWPDVFLIPVPRAGWAVWCGADRVLVRVGDGTGFATSRAAFAAFLSAAGTPPITLYGGVLPADLVAAERASLPPVPDPLLAGFDLRAGLRRAGGPLARLRAVRPLAIVLLLAVLAHLALTGLDVIALNRMADQRAAELRAVLMVPEGADLDVALTQALAARQPADTGGVLPLLSQAFAAIAAQTGRVSVQDLQYGAADRTAVLTLEAPDLSTLQAVEAALIGAGLGVSAGAATARDGAAEIRFTLREGGA